MSRHDDERLLTLIRGRLTVEEFEAGQTLDEETIRSLIEDACQAPSSFNIQHWRFVAVRAPEDRKRLSAAAFNQPQVADAAVTFIVLGDLRGIDRLPSVMERAVAAGALSAGKSQGWVRAAKKIYHDEQLNRDEAIRSCSLATMVLMLSAEARGLGAGALIGFDPEAVKREFEIPEHYLPVMLVPVGRPAKLEQRRKPRFEVDEVLSLDRCRETD